MPASIACLRKVSRYDFAWWSQGISDSDWKSRHDIKRWRSTVTGFSKSTLGLVGPFGNRRSGRYQEG